MKILIVDIETAPALSYVWQFYKTNIGADQVLTEGSIMSFAAKWLGEKEVFYYESQKHSEEWLLKKVVQLLDEADVVVAHNGDKFDMPKIRGRCLKHGIDLPSPYKQIDTCKVARKEFGFEANSQQFLAGVLGCAPKQKHNKYPGFELWLECLKGNKDAWRELKEYNISDVLTLEQMYVKIRPYITNHPNAGVMAENGEITCPKCGSTTNQKRGHYHTTTGKYQRYQCTGCGGWHRSRYTEYPKDRRKVLTVNAV